MLVEYETRPGVTVENLQQVRAVYDKAKGQWELHLVCKDEVETPTAPGNETADVDLGICNFAAVAYSTEEADLYPGNRLKQDGHYFPKEIAKCDDSGGQDVTRLHHKWSERRTHFFHSLTKHIVEKCIERGVGRINIGKLEGVREDENGDLKNWGKHGNLALQPPCDSSQPPATTVRRELPGRGGATGLHGHVVSVRGRVFTHAGHEPSRGR